MKGAQACAGALVGCGEGGEGGEGTGWGRMHGDPGQGGTGGLS